MILYNTFTKRKETFNSISPDTITIYECGPTVYDFIHIGNARPMCVFDSLRRYFLYCGYNVIFTQNFTDVDDKIINRAKIQNKSCNKISKQFIDEYNKDAAGLNILPPTYAPKVTENIENIQKIIAKLIKLDMAYNKNGTIYFKTRQFKDYGKLSSMQLDELNAGARVKVDEEKEDNLDFALWKAAKEGEIFWESPWGKGRPGWHIECSAMIDSIFEGTIDIHCGGQDLIFPHHENEIAQSTAYSGKPLANYWLHNGYINISNQKMSKSLGNFFTVREIAKKYGYMPIRLMMLQSHYRTPINYNSDSMVQNLAALQRIETAREMLQESLMKMKGNIPSPKAEERLKIIFEFKERFISELENDFNTAGAIGVLFEMIKYINLTCLDEKNLAVEYIESAAEILDKFLYILGLNLKDVKAELNEEIKDLIKLRQEAKTKKDFKTADEIRQKLQKFGIILEDTANGVKIKKLGGSKIEEDI